MSDQDRKDEDRDQRTDQGDVTVVDDKGDPKTDDKRPELSVRGEFYIPPGAYC